MRILSSTLLAEQKKTTTTPYVKVEASNLISGVVRLDWSRLYTGAEDDYFHAVTIPGDGSLIRVRITPPADARKLYRQRVTNPDETSDYSAWTYITYNCAVVTCASLGAEVSIFWIDGVGKEVYRIKSTDNGATWGSPELIDYSPTTAIYGIAAAYKPNGDLALFWADQATLYLRRLIAGAWQARENWDKTTGDLSGVACVYDTDWNLFITGKDTAGNFKLWSFIYGDGGDVAAGTWSPLKEFASAAAGEGFEYHQAFMAKPDVYRIFFVEKFTGVDAYNRPFWSHSIPTTTFFSNLWREPVPFNLSSEYGLAIAHHGDYCWLSSPNGVWRAPSAIHTLDLTADVLSSRVEQGLEVGKLTIELRNDDGRYSTLPSPLDIGCQLDFSPGYVTSVGNEVSPGQTFILQAYEHTSSDGKSSLILYASDGWNLIASWRARHQFFFDRLGPDWPLIKVLEFVLARVGLKLEVISQSGVTTDFYPNFLILPGNRGDTIIRRLLSFIPDVFFVEGNKAYLVNPLAPDASVYSYETPYATDHVIHEGRYRLGAWELNRIQVEGLATDGSTIITDSFAWPEISRLYDRFRQLYDGNIYSVAKAQERGQAYLREAEIESISGIIRVPTNCGQQLFDVIDITDSRAGLSAEKKRVLGLILAYNPRRGEYDERLLLGAV
jgi:hypothetical protein